MNRITLFVVPLLLAAACEHLPPAVDGRTDLRFTFDQGAGGWTGAASDYPPDNEADLEFKAEVRALPSPLDTGRKGFFVSAHNRPDDVFAYLKRRVEGLAPNQEYHVRFRVELASSVGSTCAGAGGAPGQAVVVKAGASTSEPVNELRGGWYRLTLDKGNQIEAGTQAVILGDIGIDSDKCGDGPYRLKELAVNDHVTAKADAQGRLWVAVGTDSGFEGVTALYYTSIRVILDEA